MHMWIRRVEMQLRYNWRYDAGCASSDIQFRSFGSVIAFFPVGTSADDESRRRDDGGKGGRSGGRRGRIHRRRKKKDTATRARRKELRNVSRQIGRGVGKGYEARASDSLRQLRRQINMPGRAISNIRRSRRVGASCVRARELRWWRSTAGRIRDSLARPVAIASADRKVNGRWTARIKDPFALSVCAKDESFSIVRYECWIWKDVSAIL